MILDSSKEGIVKLELRFSPEFMAEPAVRCSLFRVCVSVYFSLTLSMCITIKSQQGLEWDAMMGAILKGKDEAVAAIQAAGGEIKVLWRLLLCEYCAR